MIVIILLCCSMASADPSKRLQNLCGLSLSCSGDDTSGFMVLPSAQLGLVQLPFGGDGKDAPSRFNKNLGFFKPSVGATFRYWFKEDWLDVHGQFLYGDGGDTTNGDGTYLWGATVGLGAVFSVISIDVGFMNRRYKTTSDGIDTGGVFLINLDLTAIGVAAGTAAGSSS
ncbi:MAG TPA: hypothetical protein VFW85_06385 [Gaiellaceae bacterium]|nr:hypothetical protein [Gaiellaceae bacterium]